MENTINMGKIIISLKLLGEQHFVNTALFHADLLAEEKGLNKELLSKNDKLKNKIVEDEDL